MSTSPDSPRRRSSAWLWLSLLVLLAMLAPLVANDVPLVARVDGELRWPAFASYLGGFVAPPDVEHALSWKEWWVRIPSASTDFAWMPPWPYGPDEVDLGQRFATPGFEHPLGNDAVGRGRVGALAARRLGGGLGRARDDVTRRGHRDTARVVGRAAAIDSESCCFGGCLTSRCAHLPTS